MFLCGTVHGFHRCRTVLDLVNTKFKYGSFFVFTFSVKRFRTKVYFAERKCIYINAPVRAGRRTGAGKPKRKEQGL